MVSKSTFEELVAPVHGVLCRFNLGNGTLASRLLHVRKNLEI